MSDITPSDVLSDPDFHTLIPIERLKVLYHIDPEYRKLHPRERWKVVNLIPEPPPEPQATQRVEAIPVDGQAT